MKCLCILGKIVICRTFVRTLIKTHSINPRTAPHRTAIATLLFLRFMSLATQKDKNELNFRFGGKKLEFAHFEAALSSWALATNPHILCVMEGRPPFHPTMRYTGTLQPTLTFSVALAKFPVAAQLIKKDHRSVTIGGDGKVVELKAEEADPEGQEEEIGHVSELLQGYFDQLCRALHRVIMKSITKSVATDLINACVAPGDGLSAWNVVR